MSYLSKRLPGDPVYFKPLGHLIIPLMLTKSTKWKLCHCKDPPDNGPLEFPWGYTNRRLRALRLTLQT